MTPFLQLALLLAFLLLAAKLAGYAAIRLGQPSVLGELLVGIALGPSLLNVFHLPFVTDVNLHAFIKELGELGVLVLMFIAGLELHLDELSRSGRVSVLAGTLGVLFPVGLGWGVGVLFGMEQQAALFLGLTLGATSVSISAQTLMELKVLRSRVGFGLLGAAVFDDILVILLLSLFFAVTSGAGGAGNILWVLVRMGLYLALALAFGLLALPRLIKWVRTLPVSQSVLTFSIIVMLIYSVSAELLGGMASITGAFLAGLMFARSPEREALEPRIGALAYGFFVPIFFVDIGLEADLRVMGSALGLTLVIVVVAVWGKLLGAGLGARLSGFSWRESAQLGTGMVSRGEVGLIVASVGMASGLLDDAVFSAIVGMVVLTTLLTPVMLRALFRREGGAGVRQRLARWLARLRRMRTPNKAGELPILPAPRPEADVSNLDDVSEEVRL